MRQGGLGAADTVLGAPVAEARSETMDVIGSPAIYANFSTRPPYSLGTPDHSGSRRQGEDWQPWTQFRTQTHRGGECAEGLPTAGQLMAEERDTRSEIGTPRAQDSARLMTAPVRLRGPDTTGTRAAVGLSK
jgi:hypothetical protein